MLLSNPISHNHCRNIRQNKWNLPWMPSLKCQRKYFTAWTIVAIPFLFYLCHKYIPEVLTLHIQRLGHWTQKLYTRYWPMSLWCNHGKICYNSSAFVSCTIFIMISLLGLLKPIKETDYSVNCKEMCFWKTSVDHFPKYKTGPMWTKFQCRPHGLPRSWLAIPVWFMTFPWCLGLAVCNKCLSAVERKPSILSCIDRLLGQPWCLAVVVVATGFKQISWSEKWICSRLGD